MSALSSSLRPYPAQTSPTSSASSQNTTPTSPYFTQANNNNQQRHAHPYARDVRHQSSANSLSTITTNTSISISGSSHVRPPTPPLLHPPPGQPFSSYLRSWGTQDLAAFLNLYRCGQYTALFQRNDIDGKVLLDLDMAALKEIGVSKVGERVKLLAGIKDLRRRAAAGSGGGAGGRPSSRIELRLNGAATPPLDHGYGHGHGSPVHPPSEVESSQSQPSRFAQPSAASSSARRLNSSRPPPLDLQHYSSSRVLPQAYQNSTPSSSSLGRSNSTTPRPLHPVQNPQLQRQASVSRPSLPTQTSSNTTVTPASNSVPAPNRPGNLNLRAPPPRDIGRRSPSPVNADVTGYVDRPLPPPPVPATSQSSAAEYANSITQQHQQRHGEGGRSTPTWAQSDHQYGLPKGPAPGTNKVSAIRSEISAASHRKSPSVSNTIASASTSTTPRQSSPIKAKFSAIMGGRSTPQPQVVHPFAANRSREDLVPERQGSDNSIKRSITPTPGYVVGSGAMSGKTVNPTSVDRERTRRTTGNESLASSSTSASAGALSLDDLRRQLVKFVNAEDGTMRTVNVMHVTSGVEVLERALKKFGKWGAATSHVSTDTESDEDGDRLEVDGWGVYAESDPDNDSKPLSEASLLGICLSHRDGSIMREKGLTLRRTRKLQNRKNMEDFLGETPPPPMSPTSPLYSGPRFGVVAQTPERDGKNGGSGSGMLTPPPRDRSGAAGANSIAASKKMNRASTVSVMSGLGVPMPDVPPSPSTARSPSSASFLGGKKKSMYNFFGHRPPSELISNHLAEYFPSAKKRDVEKARHSMLRMSSGPSIRGSIAAPSASESNGRMSLDIPNPLSSSSTANKRSSMIFSTSAGHGHGLGLGQVEKHTASPPRRNRAANRTTIIASPPPASTIPEESEGPEVDGANAGGVPRVSVSNDDGRIVRPSIDGESESDSVESGNSQPPLLPPFEPFNDLAHSLQAYSPSSKSQAQMGSSATIPVPTRPKSIALNRRDSAGSTRSRISMLSQLRRNRDRSDNASLLTVDEITAEVENRRASTITFEDGESDEEEEIVLPAPPQMLTEDVPIDESEESEREDSEDESTGESSSEESDDDDDDDDEDEDEDEDEDDEDDKEHGKAFTSTGSKRMFKWIKGALIGAGSFGSVFLGMDAQSGLLMAVKQVELPTGSARNEERKRSMVEALEREIELLKELQHENIVQYLDSSSDGAHLNIFLEYVPGGSVAALLNNYGAFEEALVRNFVRQILTGLNYLHEREIIHRDIKGANILVDNKGGIKISDFGISKKVENNLMTGMRTNRPSLQGSVFWMAPEIVKQTSYTSKADIWSVGCLVVEMLTGTHPWADLTQMQAIFRIGSTAPRPAIPSDISPEAADLLNRSFEIDHMARPTAKELLEHPFISTRRLSTTGSAGQGTTISNSEAQRKMGMAMAAAGQGMGMMMKA